MEIPNTAGFYKMPCAVHEYLRSTGVNLTGKLLVLAFAGFYYNKQTFCLQEVFQNFFDRYKKGPIRALGSMS